MTFPYHVWAALEPYVNDGSLNWWWCYCTLAYATVMVTLLVLRTIPKWLSLRSLRQSLTSLGDAESFGRHFRSYSDTVRKVPSVAHSWAEFEESLVLPAPGEGSRVRNTREPSFYFNTESIIDPDIHTRLFDSVPGHLVGLGILGTFIGLAAGIGIASKRLHSQNVQELTDALGVLLDGASMAFLTSIFGLGLSLVFVAIDRGLLGGLRSQLNEWVAEVEARLDLLTPETVALQQLREAKQQSFELQRLNQETVSSVGHALDDRVTSKMVPELKAIVASVDTLRDDRAEWSLKAMEQLIDRFTVAVTQSAGTELRELAFTIRQASQDMRDILAGTAESNRVAQEKLVAAAREMESAASRAAADFTRGMSDAATSIRTQLSGAGDELVRRLGDASGKMVAAGDAASAAFAGIEVSLKQAAGHVDQASRRSAEAWSEQMSGVAKSFSVDMASATKEIAQGLASGATGMASVIQDAAVGFSRAVGEGAESIRSAGGDASTELGKLATEFGGLIGEAAKLSGAVADRGSEVTALTARLGEAAREWTGAQDRLRSVLGPMVESLVTASAAAVAGTRSLEPLVAQSSEAARALVDQNGKIAATWDEYRVRFEDVDRALGSTVHALVDGTRQYSEQVNSFARQLDEQMAKAVDRLGAGTAGLASAVESLDDTVERLVEAGGPRS